VSHCPVDFAHPFRAFRSFRGQIFFLPVRLRGRRSDSRGEGRPNHRHEAISQAEKW
jgi:hypothetical protein